MIVSVIITMISSIFIHPVRNLVSAKCTYRLANSQMTHNLNRNKFLDLLLSQRQKEPSLHFTGFHLTCTIKMIG